MERNTAQKKAIEHTGGPLLIVAGAGTGKTTVIVDRLLWLLENAHAKPDDLLALTFTEKATEEMVDRVDKQLEYGYAELWISTFHSFCERILHDHALDIGIPNEFKLFNTVDAWVLVRRNLEKFALDYYRPLGNPTKFIKALIQHFSRCKDEAITPEEYLEYATSLQLDADAVDGVLASRPHPRPLPTSPPPSPARRGGNRNGEGDTATERARLIELANAYYAYQQLLLDNGALDFGDLLLYTLKLFRERPAVLERYRNRFKHILVDEFQDTNWIQYAIVKLLAAPKNNVTVVSDDDQSIYQWRGASMSNILQFKKDFPDVTSVVLVENYRSKQEILDAAYAFIQKNNPNRLEVQLAEERLTKQLIAARGNGGTIALIHATTETDEAKKIAEKILALRVPNREAEPLAAHARARGSASPTDVSWSDFAVLIRANRQAEPFLRVFDRLGIPYQFLASKGLYSKPVILDLIAYLKLCDNYHESPAFYRLLTCPVVAMDEFDVVALMHEAGKRNMSLFALAKQPAALRISKESQAKLATAIQWIERHTRLARTKRVGEVLYAFLEDSGYVRELTKEVQHSRALAEHTLERVRHVEQFFQELLQFEQSDPEPTVQRFLDVLRVREEAGDEGALENALDDAPDAVTIMTIHGSKGLEFRSVFVPQLVELRFPSVDRRDPIQLPDALVKEILPKGDTHLEEERRLMYVAMTRARDQLFLSFADDYGGARKKRPSVFLSELGLVEAKSILRQRATQQELTILTHHRPEHGAARAARSLRLPERLSYSQLKAFDTCPLQYKFAHLLRIPVRGKFTLNFGKSVHAALERFFKTMIERDASEQQALFERRKKTEAKTGRNAPTLPELITYFNDAWIPEWYTSKKHEEEYFALGIQMLKEFYRLHDNAWPELIAVEQPFTMKVGGYILKGKIDRIDRTEKGARVVDYKTGTRPERLTTEDKRQLLLYQLAVEETLGKKTEELVYYYLADQKPMTFVGTAKDIDKLTAWIATTGDAITTSVFVPTPSPQVCRNCDYKDICEYKQL